MSPDYPASQLDAEQLSAEVAEFLATVPVAEGLAAVRPQAARAADLGLDPAPFLAVVSDVLRLYAEALDRPDAAVA
jgi:hypothetical protein